MTATEFHPPGWSDGDGPMEFFTPVTIGLQKRKAVFKLSIPSGEGIVRLVSATPITEIDQDDLEDLIAALQEARDFLDEHPTSH